MAEAATLNRNTDKPLKLDAAIKKKKKTPVTFKGETGEILGFPNAPCSHKILEAWLRSEELLYEPWWLEKCNIQWSQRAQLPPYCKWRYLNYFRKHLRLYQNVNLQLLQNIVSWKAKRSCTHKALSMNQFSHNSNQSNQKQTSHLTTRT